MTLMIAFSESGFYDHDIQLIRKDYYHQVKARSKVFSFDLDRLPTELKNAFASINIGSSTLENLIWSLTKDQHNSYNTLTRNTYEYLLYLAEKYFLEYQEDEKQK